jgi:GNAT superfamily N-acetyltransferase
VIRELDQRVLESDFLSLLAEVECGHWYNPADAAHALWLQGRIRRRFACGARFFAAYLDDGAPVGFTGIEVEPGMDGVPYLGQYSEVVAIGVVATRRRLGHGSRLLEFSERHARDAGAYCLYVGTYAGADGAIRFYEANGFGRVATLPDVHGPRAAGRVYLRKLLREETSAGMEGPGPGGAGARL